MHCVCTCIVCVDVYVCVACRLTMFGARHFLYADSMYAFGHILVRQVGEFGSWWALCICLCVCVCARACTILCICLSMYSDVRHGAGINACKTRWSVWSVGSVCVLIPACNGDWAITVAWSNVVHRHRSRARLCTFPLAGSDRFATWCGLLLRTGTGAGPGGPGVIGTGLTQR